MKPDTFFKKIAAFSLVAGLASASVSATAAQTLTFSDVNATSTTLYYKYDGTAGNFLAAEVTFDLLSIGTTTASFGITLKNTSNTAGVRMGGFAVDNINPNVTSVITNPNATGTDWEAITSGNYPSGFNSVEFCATVGNSCSGGGNDGLGVGISDYFEWTLTAVTANPGFGTPGSIAFVSPIPVRFQALPESLYNGLGSIAFDTCSPTCNPPPPPPPPPQCGVPGTPPCLNVPEPGSLALASLGLLGLGFGLRRRRFA